jgi:MFS transporter, ACS family, D-galactonate transporter
VNPSLASIPANAPSGPSSRPVQERRWRVVTLLLAAVVINYIDRGNLNLTAVPVMKELGISPAGMGTLLSAFFWTYALTQIPAGYLADRYGLKWTYAAGFVLWSAVSIGIGLAQSLGQILVLRLLLGVAEAVAIPAGMAYIRRNFAPEEQGLPTGIFAAGAMFGPAVGTFLGSYLLSIMAWRWIFILTGAGALVWLVPWVLYAPGRHPEEQQAPKAVVGAGAARFLLRNRLVWGIALGVFFYQYGFYFCLTWLPAYLLMERQYSFLSMGLFTGLPLLVMGGISILGGRVSDLCARRLHAPLLVRRGFVAGGMLCGATFILILTQVESRPATAAVLLLSFAGIGIAGTNYWALTQLVCPSRLIGRVVGVQNTVGNIAGICAPLLTGVLVGREKNFHLAITLAGISLACGALSYLFLIREQDYREIQERFDG